MQAAFSFESGRAKYTVRITSSLLGLLKQETVNLCFQGY